MDSEMTYGLVARSNSPLLALLLCFLNQNRKIKYVVIKEKGKLSDKDLKIWESRTTEVFRACLKSYESSKEFQSASSKVLTVKDINSDETVGVMKSKGINALVNAGSPSRIDQSLITLMEFGILNCHPGSLPDFRGASAVEWALKEKKQIVNTVHFMNSELDAGNIIQEEAVHYDVGSTYQEIRSRVYFHGARLLADVMSRQTSIKFKPIDFAEQPETSCLPRRPICQDELMKIQKTLTYNQK